VPCGLARRGTARLCAALIPSTRHARRAGRRQVSSPREQRVAFVLGQRGRGGTEAQSQLLVRALRERGIDVDVFILEAGPLGVTTDFADAPVRLLGGARGSPGAGVLNLLGAALRLGIALRSTRYDVIHAALARAYLVAPLVAPWRPRPRIVVWRRNLGGHLRPRGLSAALEKVATRLSDVVISNSESVREYWIKRGHATPAQSRVIANALEPWRFDRPPPEAAAPGTQRLVAVGGLRPVKGHDLLLEAASELTDHASGLEVAILGLGDCADALEVQARAQRVRLVLPGHVADPRPWLRSAAVYVHPSHSEGSSNAIAEAMAQGCAIVATDVGGAREMLGATGLLIPLGDVLALRKAMHSLLLDRSRREALGEQASRRAKELFALDRVVDQHLDAYSGG